MKNKFFTIQEMMITAMFTAVLAILSIIQIPMPSGVPITLQTFAVALCGYVLGWKRGGASVFIYLLIGALGVPVFAGMKGGFGVLFGPTGGFIFGFIGMAVLCGLSVKKHNKVMEIIWGVLGLTICHLMGAVQFSLVMGNSMQQSFLLVSLPYLLKDVISVIGAYILGKILRKELILATR